MSNEIQYLLYSMPDADGKVQVVIKDETLWCTQKAMAQLFGVGVPAISKHLKNIFAEGELNPDTTISKMETVVNRGIRGEVKELIDFYSLDAIIAVGYRVSSLKATRFRQWATKILKEYIKKGFTMDDERLKQGTAVFGKDYFRELLERVRSIRASERRIWQQITDIYAECSPHGVNDMEACTRWQGLEVRCQHSKELLATGTDQTFGACRNWLLRLHRGSH